MAYHYADLDSAGIFIELYRVASSPTLIAIPLFTLAGFIMAESKTPQRLSRLSQCYLGGIPGGVPVAVMVACAFFTAFTGASGVTIIALGGLFYPLLLKEKYSKDFSLGLMTSSGSLGLLFPPSLPLILYGLVAQVSINELFLAGIVPGLLMIGILGLYSMWMNVRCKITRIPFRYQESAFRPAGSRLGGAPALHHCIGDLFRRVYGDRGGGGNGGLCPHHRILDLQRHSSRTGPAQTDDQQYGPGRHHPDYSGHGDGIYQLSGG